MQPKKQDLSTMSTFLAVASAPDISHKQQQALYTHPAPQPPALFFTIATLKRTTNSHTMLTPTLLIHS